MFEVCPCYMCCGANVLNCVILVSWADMIAVAGSEAVSMCGGPTIPVVLGRLDSM